MQTLGLELGGTWIRGVLVASDGTLGDRVREATPDEPGRAGDVLYSIWEELGALPGIGLAAAPELDVDGVVRRWPSRRSYEGVAVTRRLAKAGVWPLVMDDASAGAAAEHIRATERDLTASTSAYLAVGTGVGAGAVIADRLWLGARGTAMDVGHIWVPAANEVECACGRTGCLQAVASGRALASRAAELGMTAEGLAAAAEAGNAAAGALLSRLGQALGEGIRVIDRLIGPDRFILGGGVLSDAPVIASVVGAAREIGVEAPILPGQLGTWAGAIGAAVLVHARRGTRLTRVSEGAERRRWRIALVQGPNLNLLGMREPEHYGYTTLREIERRVAARADELECRLSTVQSNSEAELVDWVQTHIDRLDGILLNPAGLTAHGLALRDAVTSRPVPLVEVHLSNVHARGRWHRTSCFADIALAQVCGFKERSYDVALEGLVTHLSTKGS
jgi:3-dehydroquinate dehydratase II